MNTKILIALSLLIIVLAAWYFNKQEVVVAPTVPTAPTTSYEITEIKAVQTNPETGQTEYTLTADSLVKNADGKDEMVNAKMDWTPPTGEMYNLIATRAMLEQSTGEMTLSEDFTLTRRGDDTRPDMVITGLGLTGNTKERTVRSETPLSVVQGNDKFEAQGFSANLSTGVYEFHQIQMVFDPPARSDKPLF